MWYIYPHASSLMPGSELCFFCLKQKITCYCPSDWEETLAWVIILLSSVNHDKLIFWSQEIDMWVVSNLWYQLMIKHKKIFIDGNKSQFVIEHIWPQSSNLSSEAMVFMYQFQTWQVMPSVLLMQDGSKSFIYVAAWLSLLAAPVMLELSCSMARPCRTKKLSDVNF